MKVALVHELLTMKGGAERVMRIFAQMFPDAPIYTLLYDEKKLGDWFPKERVRVSSAQPHFPFSMFHFSLNHHLHLKKFPAAVEAWPFGSAQGDTPQYDLVLSSSSAFVHGIITNSAPRHVCYVQSPARYLWDRTHDVQARAGKGFFGRARRWYLSRLFHRLRVWDCETSDRPDTLIAASKEVQRRIELYWRHESNVIYPPIDDGWFADGEVVGTPGRVDPTPYYLIVSQLVDYKRIDLAIRACNERKVSLIIAGEGSARRSLEAIAGPSVQFVGYKTDEELRELYVGAKATIFAGEEDFGLVPLESLACGTPVVAFRGGGALETLTPETAEFFDEPTAQSLGEALGKATTRTWDAAACRAQAKNFSRSRFEEQMRAAISATLAA
ncbi:glycosyltransferase family 4 protein [Candidatus Peribacteria bacterium]|nr:glycosyltransferase family 4 protein [Candidatus Peribacteria bacterium]